MYTTTVEVKKGDGESFPFSASDVFLYSKFILGSFGNSRPASRQRSTSSPGNFSNAPGQGLLGVLSVNYIDNSILVTLTSYYYYLDRFGFHSVSDAHAVFAHSLARWFANNGVSFTWTDLDHNEHTSLEDFGTIYFTCDITNGDPSDPQEEETTE